jgi:uncharacterized protein (DUF2126 family)
MRSNGPKAENEHGGKSGVLYVFMPPLARLEDYLNLLEAVEATAEELQFQIVLEGYPPPRDPRLKLLQVSYAWSIYTHSFVRGFKGLLPQGT